MGSKLPLELKTFYEEIGYGFLCIGMGSQVNRFISAIEIADFYQGIHDYEDDPRRQHYNDPGRMVFFEVSGDSFLVLDRTQENALGQCPVYDHDRRIADSIEEFIAKMDQEAD